MWEASVLSENRSRPYSKRRKRRRRRRSKYIRAVECQPSGCATMVKV
jgi:hypothetical protein